MIGVGKIKYNIFEYILLNLYFLIIDRRLAYIQHKFYIIKNLRAYTLIGINIMVPEHIHLDFNRFIVMVAAYKNIKFNISIIILDLIIKVIFSKVRIRIPTKLDKLILIIDSKYKLFNLLYNKNFIFQPKA